MKRIILYLLLSASLITTAQPNKVGVLNWWGLESNSFSPSAESNAVFARMNTPLPLNLKILINDFVNAEVAAGNWNLIIDFGYLGLDTKPNSLTSFKGVATPVENLAYWQSYYGYRFSGIANNYINLQFVPSTNTDFIIDNCGMGAWVKEDRYVSAQKALMGVTETTAANQVYLANTGSAIVGRMNNSALSSNTGEGRFARGNWYSVDRPNSTQIALSKGSSRTLYTNAVGAAKPNQPVYLGARRNNTSADLVWAGDASAWMVYQPVGFNLSAHVSAISSLESGVQALFENQVPNYDALLTSSSTFYVFLRLGQSNTNSKAEIARMLALTDAQVMYQSSYVWDKGYNSTNNGFWNKSIAGVNLPPNAQAPGNTYGAQGVMRKFMSAAGFPTFTIDCAFDGSAVLPVAGYSDWAPSSVGTTALYPLASAGFWIPALNNLQATYPTKTIKVVIEWQEGETAATDNTATAGHAAAFDTFVTSLRASHSLLATCPLVISKIYYNLTANETTINNGYVTYAGSHSNTYVIDPAASVIADGNPARKKDLSLGIRTAYPPTVTPLADDEHDNYLFQYRKAELTYGVMTSIGY